jgi:signal transduction histidine kinase
MLYNRGMVADSSADNKPTETLYFMINVFALLAIASLGIFGILEIIVEGKPQLGYLEILGSGLITFNAAALWYTRNVILARTLLLTIFLGFLMVMLMTGGTQGTGLFWFFIFPVTAFLLTGKRQGFYWLGGLFGGTIILLLLDMFQVVQLPYSWVVIRQLLVSLLVISLGIYFYEQARGQAEQKIREEQGKLNEAKNEFLALASHQLRTPISAIGWFTEMMLHGDAGKLTSEQKEHISQIHESNQRSAAIVDAMITVSNLQAGELAMHLEEVDVAALCRRTVKNQKQIHPTSKKLTITEQYSALPKLDCDPSLLRTIIQNLISNAFKYTPEGGHITITANQDGSRLTPTSQGSVHIRVTDTGYGIPKEQQSKIFAKLFRASNITSKDTDGTGLGLYIVKTILEQVGGEIHFTSEENKGSSFTVSLPLEGMHYVQQIGGTHV